MRYELIECQGYEPAVLGMMLSQWREFCTWIKELPHGDLITSE